jgi:hypothetical protein
MPDSEKTLVLQHIHSFAYELLQRAHEHDWKAVVMYAQDIINLAQHIDKIEIREQR